MGEKKCDVNFYHQQQKKHLQIQFNVLLLPTQKFNELLKTYYNEKGHTSQ